MAITSKKIKQKYKVAENMSAMSLRSRFQIGISVGTYLDKFT